MKHVLSALAPAQRQFVWAFLVLAAPAAVDATLALNYGVHRVVSLDVSEAQYLGHELAAQPYPGDEGAEGAEGAESHHGHHGHQGAEDHEETMIEHLREKEHLAYSVCLMGGVACVMSIFYLVNSSRESVRLSTWRALNMTISIFLAVFLFGMIQKLTKNLMSISSHTRLPRLLSLQIFVVTYVGMQLTLTYCAYANKGAGLRSAGVLFSHLTGFAAMYLFADHQLQRGRESFGLTALVAVASGVILCVLNLVASKVRDLVVNADGRVDEEEEQWQDVVDDAEKDVLSLATGFCLMQSMRFLITGEAQDFEPNEVPERSITQWDVDALLVCSALFAALVAAGVWLNEKVADKLPEGSAARKVMDAVPSVASMGMAWSLLFWGEWQIYVLGFHGIRIAGCLCVALLMTVLGVALVFVLDFVPPSEDGRQGAVVRNLVLALGLLVGFSWERAFDMGSEHLAELHGKFAWQASHLIPLVMVVVVLPAWSQYVLPKAVD